MFRPNAMISITAKDLPEHRERVRKACECIGFGPREMMGHLTAEDRDAVETSLEMADRAEVYVDILAHRYGYVPDGAETSVTEMEYDRAVELDKPRLLFFWDKNTPIPTPPTPYLAHPYTLSQTRVLIGRRAYNVLADICREEGDKPSAIEAATKAYRAA